MRKFGLLTLLKDIETLTSEAYQTKDPEGDKKADASPVLESASRGKVRRPRRSKKNIAPN